MILRRNVKFILIIINLLFAFLLVLCYLVPFIDPRVFWPISFLGLLFPFVWLIVIGFMFFWFGLKKFYGWISFATLLIGWGYGARMFNFGICSSESKDSLSVKLMSYNVRNFDFYNWRHRQESKKKFFDLFKKEQPDIMCFQEFFHLVDSTKGLEFVDSLSQRLGYPHYYFHTRVKSFDQRYGMAVFSKYPIINNAKMDFKTRAKNGCIYVDVAIRDTIVRIYNVHFQSIQFDHEDYAYFEKKEWDTKAIKKIFYKLRKAFIKRAVQADFLSEHLRHAPYNVILCGDFNDTPISYTYERIIRSREFNDAFREKGRGFGSTHVGMFPFLRIDHLFMDKSIKLNYFRVLKEEYSDHYPVISEFSL